MLAPKKAIVIYPQAHVVLIRRKNLHSVRRITNRNLARLYRVLNKVVNELYGPRIELGINIIKVEW